MTHRDLSADQIKALGSAYLAVASSLDAMPYTVDFDRLYETTATIVPGLSQNQAYRLLQDLRKKKLLPTKGR